MDECVYICLYTYIHRYISKGLTYSKLILLFQNDNKITSFNLIFKILAVIGYVCFRSKRQAKVLEDYWDCSVCTYRNTAEAFKCLMCDIRKGTSTRLARIIS